MIRAESLLPDRQRALVERLGLRVLALGIVQRREVVQARGHIGMIRADRLLGDLQRLFCDHYSAIIATLPVQRHDLIVERLPLDPLCMAGTDMQRISRSATNPDIGFFIVSSSCG